MPDRYIVSSHRFCEHMTLNAAEQERDRLIQSKGKPFRIYRTKTSLKSSGAFQKMLEALEAAKAEMEPLNEGCDHSVNICWCGFHRALAMVDEAIAAARGHDKAEATE